ncbi:unnamed protein product [Prorocentrum cordatum]|uniref:Uncharacterized protein n=1 Tax=Prorocentrum cordatum TaxID=2364126 RepID=A0ABN9TY18_9DINO|nr:unnamed protein product [Polarella glacialis]
MVFSGAMADVEIHARRHPPLRGLGQTTRAGEELQHRAPQPPAADSSARAASRQPRMARLPERRRQSPAGRRPPRHLPARHRRREAQRAERRSWRPREMARSVDAALEERHQVRLDTRPEGEDRGIHSGYLAEKGALLAAAPRRRWGGPPPAALRLDWVAAASEQVVGRPAAPQGVKAGSQRPEPQGLGRGRWPRSEGCCPPGRRPAATRSALLPGEKAAENGRGSDRPDIAPSPHWPVFPATPLSLGCSRGPSSTGSRPLLALVAPDSRASSSGPRRASSRPQTRSWSSAPCRG